MAGNDIITADRPVVASFPPSLWGNKFESYVFDNELAKRYTHEIESLKEGVRSMLIISSKLTTVEKLNLVDTIERLGISYHFLNEIEKILQEIYYHIIDDDYYCEDLCTSALMFRLLRQHGYNISSSRTFERFQENGKFKESLSGVIKGLLNLYEASFMKTHNDDILEMAHAFSTTHQVVIASNLESILGKQVRHALDQPLHTGIPRLEISYFITFYHEDELRNDVLLRFAKLDYNLLQMHHKQELCEIMRWWKDLDFVTKLPYVRDRIVECYYWALGTHFELKYSKARLMLTKTIAMVSVIDDTFDTYGTLDELDIYTHAIQNWDINQMEHLPNYMKISYKALIDLYEEIDEELSQEERSYAVHYVKDRMKELVRAYNVEAKWFKEGNISSIAEYLRNGLPSSTLYLLPAAFHQGMDSITTEAIQWLRQNPKILKAGAILGRVSDDIGSYENEKSMGQTTTGIECYMAEYGVSIEEAINKFQEMAENAWKDINESILQPTRPVSMEILMPILNLSRVTHVVYKYRQDAYTNPDRVLKHHITALLLNCFEI